MTNACGADVDVFWVDNKCEEVFHKRLAQGEAWRRMTSDHQVWRIRVHATDALVKEFTPQRVPSAPELASKAPLRVLPEVVVRSDERTKDGRPHLLLKRRPSDEVHAQERSRFGADLLRRREVA